MVKKAQRTFTEEELVQIYEGLKEIEEKRELEQKAKEQAKPPLFHSRKGATVATPLAAEVTLPAIPKNKETNAIHRIR